MERGRRKDRSCPKHGWVAGNEDDNMTIEYHKEKRDPQIQWYLSHGKKRWRVRFTISIAGKKHAVKRSDFTALIDAQRYKSEAIRRLEANAGVLRDYTLKEYWDVFKDRHVKSGKWRETTALTYSQIMDIHVLPKWGRYPLDGIKRIPWQEWILEYNEDNHLSKRYMRNINNTMVSILKEAVRDDLLTKVVLEDIEVTGKEPTPKGLSHAEYQHVMTFVEQLDDLKQLMLYLATQGLRRGEILGVTFGSFMEDDIVIDEQINKLNNPNALKTAKAYRKINLPSEVLAASKKAMAMSKRIYAANGKIPGKNDRVFVDENADVMKYNRVGDLFATLSNLSGVHLNAHRFRHAFITFAYENGYNARTIADYVGHVDTAMTMSYNTGTKEALRAIGAVRLAK